MAVASPAAALNVSSAKQTRSPRLLAETESVIVAKKRKKRRKRGKRNRAPFLENSSTKEATVETNAIGLFLGVLNAEYHMKWSENTSLGGVGYLYGFGGPVNGVGVGGLYSYYMDQLFEGVYFSGGAAFSNLKYEGVSASGISLIGLGGYKHNFDDTYLVGAGAGIQYFTFSGSFDGFSAIGFSVMLNVGMYL